MDFGADAKYSISWLGFALNPYYPDAAYYLWMQFEGSLDGAIWFPVYSFSQYVY